MDFNLPMQLNLDHAADTYISSEGTYTCTFLSTTNYA